MEETKRGRASMNEQGGHVRWARDRELAVADGLGRLHQLAHQFCRWNAISDLGVCVGVGVSKGKEVEGGGRVGERKG